MGKTAAAVWMLAAVCFSAPTGSAAQPVSVPDDETFDAQYVCPESLSVEARGRAHDSYFAWASARHPQWNTAEAVDHRVTLWIKHGCAESLAFYRDEDE